MPARVLLQDFTGVPVVADLAAMRDAIKRLGGDRARINPLQPADLVIDHSVQVDCFGTARARSRSTPSWNSSATSERYLFLRWGQGAFNNFRVVPPDTGIVHQVNLEYLAPVVFTSKDGEAYPDTLLGTDSHTTMINGLGVVGWGVGGIEAEAAMLGRSMPMLIPEVIGFGFTGAMRAGRDRDRPGADGHADAAQEGVVNKFVEYFGSGLGSLSVADRATLGNMSPEYGATIGFFPVDAQTLAYLRLTRPRRASGAADRGLLQGSRGCSVRPIRPSRYSPTRSNWISCTVEPSLAGPRRPQDRVRLRASKSEFRRELAKEVVAITKESIPRRSGRWIGEGGSSAARRISAISAAELGRAGASGRGDDEGGERFELGSGRGGDRRDHELHQHLQSFGDARGGDAGEKGGRARAQRQAVGQDQPRAGIESGHRLSQARGPDRVPRAAALSIWSATAARPVSATAARFPKRSPRRSSRATWSSAQC